tara:strand:+ start:6150 stop:6920 length:771 start_codon:yes stop_codon:yes gene_type:complete
MNNKKLWYSLEEAAQVLACSKDHLLYLGTIGEIKLALDWVIIRNESNLVALNKRPYFNFLEIIDSYYCEHREMEINVPNPFEMPQYSDNPLLRLAYLSSDDIGLISKKKQITLRKASLSNNEYISVDCREYKDNYKNNYNDCTDDYIFPVLTIQDVVIKSEDLETYQRPSDVEQKPVIESTKENTNLYKTIGLLSQALIDSGSKNLMKGDEPNYSAIARKLERFIPTDPLGMKECHGLSERSLRERIKKGLDSLII